MRGARSRWWRWQAGAWRWLTAAVTVCGVAALALEQAAQVDETATGGPRARPEWQAKALVLAAQQLGLAAAELRLLRVSAHRDGDKYEFQRPGSREVECEVVMPSGYVFGARFRPGRPSSVQVPAGALLSRADAVRAADAFVKDQLHESLADFARPSPNPGAEPEPATRWVQYNGVRAAVDVPSYILVEFDAETGDVLSFVHQPLHLTVSLQPALSAEVAARRALKAAESLGGPPHATGRYRVGQQWLRVEEFDTDTDDDQTVQKLVWRFHLDPVLVAKPPAAGVSVVISALPPFAVLEAGEDGRPLPPEPPALAETVEWPGPAVMRQGIRYHEMGIPALREMLDMVFAEHWRPRGDALVYRRVWLQEHSWEAYLSYTVDDLALRLRFGSDREVTVRVESRRPDPPFAASLRDERAHIEELAKELLNRDTILQPDDPHAARRRFHLRREQLKAPQGKLLPLYTFELQTGQIRAWCQQPAGALIMQCQFWCPRYRPRPAAEQAPR